MHILDPCVADQSALLPSHVSNVDIAEVVHGTRSPVAPGRTPQPPLDKAVPVTVYSLPAIIVDTTEQLCVDFGIVRLQVSPQ